MRHVRKVEVRSFVSRQPWQLTPLHAARTERIAQIARSRFNLDPDAVLEKAVVWTAFNFEHQIEIVEKAIALLGTGQFKLMCIDGLSQRSRQEYQGRPGQLAERQFAFSRMLRQLNTAAQEFNVAVVYTTNQVVANRPKTCIQLKKGTNNCIVKLIDSPWRLEGDCQLQQYHELPSYFTAAHPASWPKLQTAPISLSCWFPPWKLPSFSPIVVWTTPLCTRARQSLSL